MIEKASWNFAEGDEVVAGRRARKNLGGGTTSEAYLAWDEQRCALVVCKLLRPDHVADDSALRELRREAGLLARLAHPAIVRCFAAVLDGPRPHLLLEHLAGPNLRRRIRRRGPLPVERALALALHLGAALHFLRSQGVVHLDVKPSNVVLGAPPRLIDLSIARTLERARRIQRPVGTANYMAPEQCAPGERGEIGSAADVWGFGVTLYEALSGRLPFPEGAGKSAPDAAARYPQLVTDPAPLQGDLPAALGEIVMQCLSRESAARPTARDLVATLEPVAETFKDR